MKEITKTGIHFTWTQILSTSVRILEAWLWWSWVEKSNVRCDSSARIPWWWKRLDWIRRCLRADTVFLYDVKIVGFVWRKKGAFTIYFPVWGAATSKRDPSQPHRSSVLWLRWHWQMCWFHLQELRAPTFEYSYFVKLIYLVFTVDWAEWKLNACSAN